MTGVKQAFIRAGLETLYLSGMHHLARPMLAGAGAILSIHHVRPRRKIAFQPNRNLEVSPRFLDAALGQFHRWKVDVVSLDEMYRRLTERDFKRRFVCFTLDGGYADHKEWAYSVFKKHAAPFAMFLPTSFADRRGELWWQVLEAVVAKTDEILMLMNGREQRIECVSVAEKEDVYTGIYDWLMRRETDEEIRESVRDLAARYHVDIQDICNRECLTWDQISEIARDPLVTVGAHSVTFPVLSKIAAPKAQSEIKMSRAVIEGALGRAPNFLAYPFGERDTAGPREFKMAGELGFKAAFTSRAGLIYPGHVNHLRALPRLTLGASYRKPRNLRVLLSGLPNAISRGPRRVDVT
jgi:peptidoglycan/xylan/chitin deacetylase (PgdA/CDA1 family)